MKPNENYDILKGSYLFYDIEQKVKAYSKKYPDKKLLKLGVGDVTLPLCGAVIKAMHKAVDEQSEKSTFHGYMPECGWDKLKGAIKGYYEKRNVSLKKSEIFISTGAGDDLGNILDMFSKDNTALVIEPTYPAYVDSNIIAGHKIVHLPADDSTHFAPYPYESIKADIIYICSPNNPTGAVFDRKKFKAWVDYALKNDAIIIFDAAYEAFITDSSIPHSIFEIDGSKNCAIEICSLSKTAGFTGVRCGYTIIPETLIRNGMSFNQMWVRNRTTKSNGVSYVVQCAALGVFSEEGQKEIQENLNVYRSNAKVLTDALDRLNIWYCGGTNAPYIWFKCPENLSSWECFDKLMEEKQIIGTPGVGFGKCGEGYFRLSSFGDCEETKEAASRLTELFRK